MGTWKTVALLADKEDQVNGTYDSDSGVVTVTLTQTWVAVTDGTTRSTTTDSLSASDGTYMIPALASELDSGGISYTVTNTRPKRTGPYSFEVQIQGTYTNTPAKAGNPTKWNVQVSFGGEEYSQDASKDKDDNAITNSAGQPYDPTLRETFSDEKISISYQTSVEQSASFTSIRGKVNSASVTLNLPGISRTFDTRTCKILSADQSGSVPLDGGAATWTVSLDLLVRTDGFIDHVIDQGYYTYDHVNSELVQIKDKYGDLLSAPALLDGNGEQLTPGGTPIFNDYEIEKEADFTTAFEGLS